MVRVTVNAADLATRGLEAAAASGARTAPLMQAIANRVRNDAMLNFRRGGVWPETWSQSRAARERSGRTMMERGALRNSIHARATATEAIIGTDLIYAAIHQFGGIIRPRRGQYLRFRVAGGRWATVRSVRIPARPFLPVDRAGNLRPETERWIGAEIGRRFSPGGRGA